MDKKELNNKVILLRKSLKSIIQHVKLNLSKKIKALKSKSKQEQSVLRKESELEALKRIKVTDIPLQDGVDTVNLQKTLSNPASSEMDRVVARVLTNPLVQKTIKELVGAFGPEKVEIFLKDNQKNILKNKNQPKKKKNKKKEIKQKPKAKPGSDSDEVSDECEVSENEDQSEDDRIISATQESPDESNAVSENESMGESEDEPSIVTEKPVLKPESTPVPNISNSDQEEEVPKVPKQKKPRKRSRVEVFQKSVDPFFLDSSGQNYLAAVRADEKSSESEDEREMPIKKPMTHGKKFTQKFKKPIRSKRFDERPPKKNFVKNLNHPVEKFPNQKSEIRSNKFEKKPAPEKKATVAVTSNDADVHPSWKAKAQMRKTQIQGFKGVKIKFDD